MICKNNLLNQVIIFFPVIVNSLPKQLVVIGDSSVYGWGDNEGGGWCESCLLYTSPSPRDRTRSRMPSSA